jgi:transcription initiation factor TFIID subunit 7
MVSENIVRDRTLVLRVLVPGLHTQLSDKLLAKQEGADNSNNNNPASSNPASSSGGGNPNSASTSSSTADQVLNLEGVTCLPSSAGSTLWHFRCDGATYPARLVNLPCPVEVHKTHDHATYHKSADIGQMLIVYEDEYAMEEAENEKGYKIEGFPSYYHSGLSPPMKRVVQRRFRARFEERESSAIPPPHKEVSEVEKEIQELITQLSAKPGKQKGRGRGGGGGSSSNAASSSSTVVTTKEKVIEEIEDEIVDYEPWMEGGKIYTIEDAKKHPEWWLTKDEMKEIEIAKKAEEEEQQRRAEKAEEKKKRKKEKKKKKEEEKQQQQQQQQAAAAASVLPEKSSSGSSKKKGIPSLNSRLSVEEEPIDDVEAAARMFVSGQGGNEDDFLFELEGGEDMFDFDNEDIGNLL